MNEQETIFHKIIRKEIQADILYEDELCLAFRDVNPVSPSHILIIPKKTIPSLKEIEAEDKELLGHMLLCCSEIAREQNIADEGYRVVINTGENGCQSVFQLHMHLLGGRKMTWPPG